MNPDSILLSPIAIQHKYIMTLPMAGTGYLEITTKDNNFMSGRQQTTTKSINPMKQHFNLLAYESQGLITQNVACAGSEFLAVFLKRYQKVSTDMKNCEVGGVSHKVGNRIPGLGSTVALEPNHGNPRQKRSFFCRTLFLWFVSFGGATSAATH